MALLAVPVTIKTADEGGNERLDYAVSAMQGHRPNMEDAHAIVLDLDAATGTSFFGVYDGHGGPAVSEYCAKQLHLEHRRNESFRDNLQTAIERTFLRVDEMMKDWSAGWELSGYGGNDDSKAYRMTLLKSLVLLCQKTAYPGPQNDGWLPCMVLIRGNQIIVGNAGDSRCVLSRNDVTKAVELSTDFKPDMEDERARIINSGHQVVLSQRGNVHRIDDGIAISRSFGDLCYKDRDDRGPEQQAIIAFPEVCTEEITQDDQLLIIPCHGNREQVVFGILEQSALIVNNIRNTVTLVLDGTNSDVLEQYITVMAHIRFWFVSNGVSINLLPILGYEKFVHIVPVEGTLHLALRYGARSVNLIIDARDAWLYGEAGANIIAQFERKGCTSYIQHEYCISLKGRGTYGDITKSGVGDIPIGIDALRTLCSLLSEADENDLDQIEKQLGVAVAHIMEPMKFHKAFEVVCKAIISGETTTFNEKDPTLQLLVKIWGKSAKELGKHVFDHLCSMTPSFHLNTSLPNTKLNDAGIKTLEDIVENIFILPHAFIPKAYIEQKKKKKKKKSSLVHSTWKPVDLGNGDPNVVPLKNLYRRIQDQREQNIKDRKFILDRTKYFGDRLGGKPCSQAVAFVKSGATSCVFSWKASMPLPVRGKHILNVVHIAKKFSQFLK